MTTFSAVLRRAVHGEPEASHPADETAEFVSIDAVAGSPPPPTANDHWRQAIEASLEEQAARKSWNRVA